VEKEEEEEEATRDPSHVEGLINASPIR